MNNKGVNMTDQTDRLIEEVQSKNKAENYERENTIKLHTLQDIWNNTNQLDNITEHMMRKFKSIMAGGR
jgi:hypothetical protein